MRTLTESAQAAKAIKQELNKTFPYVKFSVKSDNFSMGDSVNISWNDGPSTGDVENITSKYQYGHFNGMEDIYENSNRRTDIPQSKYVSCNRHFVEIEKLRDEFNKMANAERWSNYFYMVAQKCSLPENANNLRIERTGNCGLIEDVYSIVFDLPVNNKEKKINGSFQIIDYSEKAIAVFGETKPIKDALNQLGGRFNAFLQKDGGKCAGWVFPKTKSAEVESLLFNNIPTHKQQPVKQIIELNLSESLMKKAEAVREQAEKIDDSVKGNWTNRRQNMADAMSHKKQGLFKIANILENLSAQWGNDSISDDLKGIKSRSDVEFLLYHHFPSKPKPEDSGNWYAKEYPAYKKKVDSMGIKNEMQYNSIRDIINSLGEIKLTKEQEKENELKELMKKVHSFNITGFFPTPDALINQMIDILNLSEPVKNILEPSAGIGSICDKINNLAIRLECCEIQYTLSEILMKKGFNVVSNDIYNITGRHNYYDAIVMNPPFEKREDLKQVMFCFDLLNDCGTLVSIISAGSLTGEFTEWLSDKDYEIFDTPKDSFKSAFNSTGVQVKIIKICK